MISKEARERAASLLDQIYGFTSPAIDNSDAHGKRGQPGHVIWDSSEKVVLIAIAAALDEFAAAQRIMNKVKGEHND